MVSYGVSIVSILEKHQLFYNGTELFVKACGCNIYDKIYGLVQDCGNSIANAVLH